METIKYKDKEYIRDEWIEVEREELVVPLTSESKHELAVLNCEEWIKVAEEENDCEYDWDYMYDSNENTNTFITYIMITAIWR